MSSKLQLISGVVGLVLIGIYSWVMTVGNGSPANWAWVILLAAVVAFVTAGRSATTHRKSDRPGQ